MGTTQSSLVTLTSDQQIKDRAGTLYKTIDDVWVTNHREGYDGEYKKALRWRRTERPVMYERVLDLVLSRLALAEAQENLREFQTVTTVSSYHGGGTEAVQEAVELRDVDPGARPRAHEMSTGEIRAGNKVVSILDSTGVTKAHLFPRDEACLTHWGEAAELVAGHQFDRSDSTGKDNLAIEIACLRQNMIRLEGNHNGIYDHLSQGVLLVIPLLSSKEIAGWKFKQPYQVLVVCNTPAAYKLFTKHTGAINSDWATDEDLELATAVLSDNAKILADSLDKSWDDYHSQKPDTFRRTSLEGLKDQLRSDGHQVRVPVLRDIQNIRLNRWNPFDKRVKLLKLDLGKIYVGEHDFAAYIPDPWSLGLKATSNWSAFAYVEPNGSFQKKLLPGCPSAENDSDDDTRYTAPSWGASTIAKVAQAAKNRRDAEKDAEIKRRFAVIATPNAEDDDGSVVSSIGDEDIVRSNHIPIVSDDSEFGDS